MAVYEYACKKCSQVTEVSASFAEKDKGLDVTCSQCGSKDVAQIFTSMAFIGPSSSSGGSGSRSSSSGCGSCSGGSCGSCGCH